MAVTPQERRTRIVELLRPMVRALARVSGDIDLFPAAEAARIQTAVVTAQQLIDKYGASIRRADSGAAR